MKKIICVIALCLSAICCDETFSIDYQIFDDRDDVYYYVPDAHKRYFKDTTINFSKSDLRLLYLHKYEDGPMKGVKYGIVNLGLVGSIDNVFHKWQTDTVSLFLFDKEIVDKTDWNTIVEKYLVLQRYDLTKDDIKNLKYEIPYPPDERMKDMKMWPRYQAHNFP